MNFLAYILVCVFFAFVFYALISFIRFAYLRIKAYVIRRKLTKLAETENKDD